MRRFTLITIIIFSISLISLGCSDIVDNQNGKSQTLSEGIISTADNKKGKKGTSASTTCQSAGDTGMTALYVNQSVRNTTIDFSSHTCDFAIYFDENAPKKAVVRNVSIKQETGAAGESTGIWNNGGEVTVTNTDFSTDFSGRFVPIQYDEGARGTILKNQLTGTHRAGILIRGEGTVVDVKGNSVVGSGAKTSGWAENGIQVDQGATAHVLNNEVVGHWWDGESNFGSTGILLIGSHGSKVTNNDLHNNEFSLFLSGSNGNKVNGNRTSSDIESKSSFNFRAYGALIGGSDNHLAGNSFSSTNGAVGIYIFAGISSNSVTGNRIKGFEMPLFDGGTDSKVRGTPAPPHNI